MKIVRNLVAFSNKYYQMYDVALYIFLHVDVDVNVHVHVHITFTIVWYFAIILRIHSGLNRDSELRAQMVANCIQPAAKADNNTKEAFVTFSRLLQLPLVPFEIIKRV